MHAHPDFLKTRRILRVVGWCAVVCGGIGLVTPILPGMVPLIVGFSLLSVESPRLHRLAAQFRARNPALAGVVKRFETAIIGFLKLSTHTHEYVRIPGETGRELHGLVEVCHNPAGVAVLLHSVSGTAEMPVQGALADFCKAQGLTVVRFDAGHGLNEDGGTFTEFTISAFKKDLECVLAWARTQAWWQKPLLIAGHSGGALTAILYAEEHPDEVGSLVLLAPTVSGRAYLDAFSRTDPDGLARWQHERLRVVRHPLSGEAFSLSYGFVEDLLTHDALPRAHTLSMPVVIIAGTHDVTSPGDTCKALAGAVGHARYVEVQDMKHTPESPHEIHMLTSALYALIKN